MFRLVSLFGQRLVALFFGWFAERVSGHAAAVRVRTGAAWVAKLARAKFMAKPVFVECATDSSMGAAHKRCGSGRLLALLASNRCREQRGA